MKTIILFLFLEKILRDCSEEAFVKEGN